jgi:hypothetical protein
MANMRTVGEIIEVVTHWVDKDGSQLPGFVGAYLFGGISQLPKDARFPDYRDIDLVIVSTEGKRPQEENLELNLDGLMLEVGIWGIEEHRSAEALLPNPVLAPNFAATTILADPHDMLKRLQAGVAKSYAERKWVLARCETEKRQVRCFLDAMSQAQPGDEIMSHLWNLLNNLSGLLALASLRKPTHRRSLTLMKEILFEHGESKLHEDALQVWGAARMNRDRVESLLCDTARIFDRALEVQRTPTPFVFKLKPHLRPYFIEASHEIIEEGNHREATFWILAGLAVGYFTLLIDAPDEEKPSWQSIWDSTIKEFDMDQPSSWSIRLRAAKELSDSVFQVADRIIAGNRRIID